MLARCWTWTAAPSSQGRGCVGSLAGRQWQGERADPNPHLSSGPPAVLGYAATSVSPTALNRVWLWVPVWACSFQECAGSPSMTFPGSELGLQELGQSSLPPDLLAPLCFLIPQSCSAWVVS